MDEFDADACKPIPGFEPYWASTDGTIWSLKEPLTPKLVRGSPNDRGYLRLCYRHKNGRKQYVCIHHLILLAHVGPRPNGMFACHGNDIHDDNRLCNLRWDTVKANVADKITNGKTTIGTRHGLSKLTERDVVAIRRSNYTNTALAKQYGVNRKTLTEARLGITWRHVACAAAIEREAK